MSRSRFAPTLSRGIRLAGALALGVLQLVALVPVPSVASEAPLRIGIIGTGRIGSALARHWIKAGHEVFVSSRHPEELRGLVTELGPRAHAGTPREAAAFGSVILVSIPYAAMPQIGEELRAQLAGKVILDTSNPIERRDGAMALEAQKKGAGIATAEFLHSDRVVRAFNCIPAATLANDANRTPERIAIPIGGDDPRALEVAEQLVRDAGFDPVRVGSLARTREFDLGQPLATGKLTASELRSKLGPPVGAQTPRPSDIEAVRAVGEAWQRYYNAGNYAAIPDLYTEDAVIMPRGRARIEGRAQVRQSIGGLAAGRHVDIKVTEREIVVAGDIAWVVGEFRVSYSPKDSASPPKTEYGRSLVIFKRGSDGAWRIHRDIDSPAPAPAPQVSGAQTRACASGGEP